jgi:hypothetical protein
MIRPRFIDESEEVQRAQVGEQSGWSEGGGRHEWISYVHAITIHIHAQCLQRGHARTFGELTFFRGVVIATDAVPVKQLNQLPV